MTDGSKGGQPLLDRADQSPFPDVSRRGTYAVYSLFPTFPQEGSEYLVICSSIRDLHQRAYIILLQQGRVFKYKLSLGALKNGPSFGSCQCGRYRLTTGRERCWYLCVAMLYRLFQSSNNSFSVSNFNGIHTPHFPLLLLQAVPHASMRAESKVEDSKGGWVKLTLCCFYSSCDNQKMLIQMFCWSDRERIRSIPSSTIFRLPLQAWRWRSEWAAVEGRVLLIRPLNYFACFLNFFVGRRVAMLF